MLPTCPDEPDNSNQNDRPNYLVELVEVFSKIVPVLAGFHSQVR